MLKKNDTVSIKIEDITNLGFGVGRYDGAVIFVSGAVTGDELAVKIIKATSSYYVGKAMEFTRLSPIRESGRCDNSLCKSCAYKEIGYAEELKIKENTVRSAFLKAGLDDVAIEHTVASDRISEYRNKAQYPICFSKDGYKIGFYAPKSHNVCEAAECPLSPKCFREILKTLREFFEKYHISAYNEEARSGLLRHIYLRYGEISGEILLTLVINGRSIPHSNELISLVNEKHSSVVGILLNVNEADTNIILGEEFKTLFGRDYIIDTLAGVKLKITAPAFYQVNRTTAEKIYEKARELADLKNDDTLLDLYCGAGAIGLSMANDAKELIGIEIVPSAVECAKFNASLNEISNAKFFVGDAADCEKLLDTAQKELGKKILPDVIILDPPRGGCDERLLEYVSRLSPKRIVYISCNPQTLARDVKILREKGYPPSSPVTPFDMFPLTGHVESLVCLTKQTN